MVECPVGGDFGCGALIDGPVVDLADGDACVDLCGVACEDVGEVLANHISGLACGGVVAIKCGDPCHPGEVS